MPRTPTSGRILIRHAAGVTRFSRSIDGIHHQLEVFVDADDPVKLRAADAGQHVAERCGT